MHLPENQIEWRELAESVALAATRYAWRVSFLFKRGVRGAAAPRISFSKKYFSMMLLLILVAFVIFSFSFIRKKTAS